MKPADSEKSGLLWSYFGNITNFFFNRLLTVRDSVVRAFPRVQMCLNFPNSQIFSCANFRLLEVTLFLFRVQSKLILKFNNFEHKDSSLCVTVFDFILLPCLKSLLCIHVKRKKGGGGVDQSETVTICLTEILSVPRWCTEAELQTVVLSYLSAGKFIMSASTDTSIHIWDLKGEVLASINTNQITNSYAAISPCGRSVPPLHHCKLSN